MKKILSIILAVVMVLSSVTFVMAADDIKITINGEAKKFDVMPQIIEGRTLVPMRAIFEALGAEVGWDDATKTATGKTASTTVALTIDNKEAKVNGKAVALDVPAQIIESRTMVPARFVAESLGCKVDWDGNTKTVIITMEKKAETTTPAASADGYTAVVNIGFENNVKPSTGINFWGKNDKDVNIDGIHQFVKYGDAGVSKPNTTEDFGTYLLKADHAKGKEGKSVKGIVEGRVNDIPAENAAIVDGGKYKMSVWAYLAETSKGGNSAKVQFRAYSGKSYFAKSSKTFTLEKGKWTKLEIDFTATSKEAGQSTGARFTFGTSAEGDFAAVVYFDNLVFSKSADTKGDAVVAPKEEPKKEEAKPSVGAEKILDAALPQSGTVIATQKDIATMANGKSIKDANGVITVTATKNEKDQTLTGTSKATLTGLIKEGNVYMLTFKARLVSGAPYVKAFIQGSKEDGYTKAVFAATKYDKEWTTCYMPFVGHKKDMVNFGFRFAGETHTTEIKDFQIIDYGTSVKIADLPNTYIVVGNTAVNGMKLQ